MGADEGVADEAGGEDGARGPARLANGRFGPGNPGRRLGSRNLITRRLVMSILADFETHEHRVLETLRQHHLAVYARLVARFLPPGEAAGEGFGETGYEGLSREALATAARRVREFHAANSPNLTAVEDMLLCEAQAARLLELTRPLLEAGAGDRDNGESTAGGGVSAAGDGDAAAAER